jgi:hypothetical protein
MLEMAEAEDSDDNDIENMADKLLGKKRAKPVKI